MANKPDIQNVYVAVFGGSGYFNEWVPADVNAEGTATEYGTENEVLYRIKVKLTTSTSRLSLHIMANCPLSEPPITGISSEDIESVVMSKVRSQIDSDINDAYWQKITLPFGVQDSTVVTNGAEQPVLDPSGNRIPTGLTVSQFTRWSPIPMIRNFARIRVQKLSTLTDVQIDGIGLAFAPAEGPVAPILPNTYTSDTWGAPVTVTYEGADDDNDGTPVVNGGVGSQSFWNEAFLMNYSGKSMEELAAAPYNYRGYSPANQALGTYPASAAEMTPWNEADWADTYLYLYERAKPRSGERATRVLIHAKHGSEDWKYYALDMVDSNKEPMAYLRNFTYTLVVSGLATGTGDESIAKAAVSTGADVSADPRTNDLTEVSDGIGLITVSYIDTTAIAPGNYSVMYRFVPDVSSGTEQNNPSSSDNPVGVSLQFGYNNGVDGFVEGTNSANGSAFASNPEIELAAGSARLYVRSGNGWAAATASQIADSSIEKWGRINYTTTTTDKNGADALDANGYYAMGFTKTIRVVCTKADGGSLYRDVQINLTPRRNMIVQCLDKYIIEETGAAETVRIFIPNDITRSMFPLEFKLQAAASSLNPRDGDNLPVSSGKSIVPGESSQSVFYFIKTLTRQDYNDARDTTIGGVQMKYFDCKFKSSMAASATTVYVANEYFNTDSGSFDNYVLRKFTATSPGELGMEQETTFRFYMDQSHTGSSVWNDAETITNTNKVIPRVVTITMTGIQPKTNEEDGTLYDTGLVKGVGTGVYYYNVAGSSTPSENHKDLHLVAGNADTYSIVLSTDQISPNPNLYEALSVTGTIVKSQITASGFTNTGGSAITSIRREEGQAVQFRFTYGGGLVPVTFKLQGLSTTDSRISGPDAYGTYTFTPTGTAAAQVINLTTTDATTECRLYDFAVADESYNQPAPDSFSLERRNRRWVTNSYTINLTSYTNANASNFTTQPQNVIFTNTERGGMGQNYYKAMGTRTWNLLSTYNNGSFTVTAPSSLTDSRITGIEMTYYGSDYDNRTVTVTGDVSTMPQSSIGMTSWTSSSTGDGNGDTTVTVTMECSSATYGNNGNGRNRLTGVTVHYGYWVED